MSRARNEVTLIHEEHRNVEVARSAFDARWTMSALDRVDRELAERLRSQVSKFHRALVVSDLDEVQKHGAATIRGYRKAIEVMEAAGTEPDAYMVGQDSQSGLKVVVARTNATLANLPAEFSDNAFVVQVDELARLFASTPNFAVIAAVAKAFPRCGVYVPSGGEAPRYGAQAAADILEPTMD